MILEELASPDVSLMLPVITMVPGQVPQPPDDNSSGNSSQNGQSGQSGSASEDILVAAGSAAFVGEKEVALLDDIETRSALILKQDITKNYVIAIKKTTTTPACSMEVISSNLDITPSVIEGNKLNFKITLDIDGDLVELLSQANFILEDRKGKLETAFEQNIRQQLIALINKVQSAGSDICGFAGITHRQLTSFWHAMPRSWEKVYPAATFDVTVNVDIISSSLSKNPIKVGE